VENKVIDINPYELNGYQLQCLAYQDNLVEFLWCMEDLKIVKDNAHREITLEDVSGILAMFEMYGMKSKLKEIRND